MKIEGTTFAEMVNNHKNKYMSNKGKYHTIRSPHEAYGYLQEEVDEFFDECKR